MSADQKEELRNQAVAAVNQGRVEDAKNAYCQLADLDPSPDNAKNCRIYTTTLRQAEDTDSDLIRKAQSEIQQQLYNKAIQTLEQVQTSKYKQKKQSLITEATNKEQEAKNEEKRKEQADKDEQARKEQADKDERARKEQADKDEQGKKESLAKEQKQNEEVAALQEKNFSAGREEYNNNRFDSAISILSRVTGARQADARAVLQKIQGYERAVHDGDRASENKRWQDASTAYRRAAHIKPENTQAELIAKLNYANSQLAKPEGGDSDTLLIQAIQDFYGGEFDSAEGLLAIYSGEGRKKALRDFYLGASLMSRSYLVTDANRKQALREAAVKAFRDSKHGGQFSPPADKISPKILKVYHSTPAA
jgi:hypothetical protein